MTDKDNNSEEFEDGLPDAVIKNAEKMEAEEAGNTQLDLLDQLVKHVDQDHYIAWEKVQLPSKGVYYDGKIPDGYLEIKPMGVDVDKMLSNRRLAQSGELLNKILEACTRLPSNFSIREMLAGDFNFLMYYLRGITHGNSYEFTTDCPHCGTKNLYNFDLSKLSETIKWADPKHPTEPFDVKLPHISKTFGHEVVALVRMIRVDDIMKMSRPGNDEIFDPVKSGNIKLHKKKKGTEIKNNVQDLSKIYDDNMKSQIVGFLIDGNEYKGPKDRAKIDQFIDKLHQGDAVTIRDFLDEVSPMIDQTLDAVCSNPDCQEETTVTLPFNENFFRPTA